MRSNLFNRMYRDFVRRTYKFCSVYDGEMNQISRWVPIVMPAGKVDFGAAPFDFTAIYYGTWDGRDIATLAFERLMIPTTVKEGDSILVTLDPHVDGQSVFQDEWRAE